MLAESKQLLASGGKTPSIDAIVRGGAQSDNALATLPKQELDPLETLMSRLGVARNRKEKRRLLAEYNQHQELVWG